MKLNRFFVCIMFVLCLAPLAAGDRGEYWTRWNATTAADNWPAAELAMREAVRLFPEETGFATCLAWALRKQGRPVDAVTMLEPLCAQRPGEKKLTEALAWSLLDVGWKQYERSAYADALVPFARAFALLPEDRYVLNAYGCVLRDTGKVDAALPLLERGYRNWPDDKYLKPNLAHAWIVKAGLLAKATNRAAESFYVKAGALDPTTENYLLNYGIFLNDRGRHQEALRLFEECLRRHPANKWVRGNIQYALQQIERALAASGDIAGALRATEAALFRFPRETWFVNDCIEYALKIGRLDRAEHWLGVMAGEPNLLDYGKPLARPREELVVHRLNAVLWKHEETGNFDRAFALLDTVGRGFPGALFIDEARGNLLFHSGRKAEGVAAVNAVYDRYIRDNPRHAVPLTLELPLRGIFLVWGNNRTESITHAGMNRFCFDFLGADEAGAIRKPGTPNPGRNADYFGFGSDVLAAADGVVESVCDTYADITPRLQPVLGSGNIIVVRDANGYHYNYVHLRQGSARVRSGQTVRTGQKLAELGNSGYTGLPHLHFGVYSSDWRVSIPVRFARYAVKRGGVWTGVVAGVPETDALIKGW